MNKYRLLHYSALKDYEYVFFHTRRSTNHQLLNLNIYPDYLLRRGKQEG